MGYCHAQKGCKSAIDGLLGASAITMDKEGKIIVGSTISGDVQVLERQNDDKLVVTDVIKLGQSQARLVIDILTLNAADRPVESLAIDKEGAIWAAGE